MTDGLHRKAELRSLALHRAVAERVRARPELLDRARTRVERWLASGSVDAGYARAWQAVLQLPLDEVLAQIVDPGERASELRQSSPFAGVLDARERWVILRDAP